MPLLFRRLAPGFPFVWIKREQLLEVGDFLKKLPKPYVMLFDLHGMDERLRTHREGLPAADFSVFYHLFLSIVTATSC
ncbi:NADH-quinone oxidoreductase subunit C/D [Escherichia coli]|uniref:NADH-quinone oxidoreductase subunit C/D n=1 Tax=Escherichia coli TaxID=562 RepID=A0A376S9L2_ECOLX|nr:NADH-quinone oxidoreductase subunit C/D [Escherichia coli]